mgnify:FL=1
MTTDAEVVPQSVYDKIRKCLALAASATEAESEAAMRQAQKLMAKYGLEKADLDIADITEGEVTVHGYLSALWHGQLLHVVGRVLGVETFFRTYGSVKSKGKVVFVGTKPKCDLAGYFYSVLMRQVVADRREFLETVWFCDRGEKTVLANKFCEQWVLTVSKRLENMFTNVPEQAQTYLERRYPNMGELKRRQSRVDAPEFLTAIAKGHGAAKGKAAQVSFGVEAKPNETAMIGMG